MLHELAVDEAIMVRAAWADHPVALVQDLQQLVGGRLPFGRDVQPVGAEIARGWLFPGSGVLSGRKDGRGGRMPGW